MFRNAFSRHPPKLTTPSAPSKVASQHFLHGASTPPHEEGIFIMRYWVIKGRSRESDFRAWLQPGLPDTWSTGRPPRGWERGDRLFFWEGSPELRVVGLGVLTAVSSDDRARDRKFDVRYLTRYLHAAPCFAELRADPVIRSASFVKSGPAGTVFPITNVQASRLYALLIRDNPKLGRIWPGLE
jgi:hypothetical protein